MKTLAQQHQEAGTLAELTLHCHLRNLESAEKELKKINSNLHVTAIASECKQNSYHYQGMIVVDDEKEELIIVSSGTDVTSGITQGFSDLRADLTLGAHQALPYKFTYGARPFIAQNADYIRDMKGNGYKITLAGHSLGGFLSTLIAYELKRYYKIEINEGIIFDAPGSDEVLNKLLKEDTGPNGLNKPPKENFEFAETDLRNLRKKFTAYNNLPNKVNTSNTPFADKMFVIISKTSDSDPIIETYFRIVKFFKRQLSRLVGHFATNFVDVLKNDEGYILPIANWNNASDYSKIILTSQKAYEYFSSHNNILDEFGSILIIKPEAEEGHTHKYVNISQRHFINYLNEHNNEEPQENFIERQYNLEDDKTIKINLLKEYKSGIKHGFAVGAFSFVTLIFILTTSNFLFGNIAPILATMVLLAELVIVVATSYLSLALIGQAIELQSKPIIKEIMLSPTPETQQPKTTLETSVSNPKLEETHPTAIQPTQNT